MRKKGTAQRSPYVNVNILTEKNGTMRLFDTHAHYNDGRFESEYPGGAEGAIQDSFGAGIIGFINCGTDPKSSRESLALADKYKNVYAACGLHPEDAEGFSDTIEDTVEEIASLLSHPKAVALGEIGLDYHWDIDRDIQHHAFDVQLSAAKSLGIPVIVHDRDAHGKTLEMIKQHPGVIGVMHGYSGSAETALEYLRLGWYISFGGPVTYKNAENVRNALRSVPTDRLLIETDCPYLPPVPYRGKVNCSAYMFRTLEAMAAARGENEEKLAAATVKNAENLFGIGL